MPRDRAQNAVSVPPAVCTMPCDNQVLVYDTLAEV